jgi:hypothetical protein
MRTMDELLTQLAREDPYRAMQLEDLPSSRFYMHTFDTIVSSDSGSVESGLMAAPSKGRGKRVKSPVKLALLLPAIVAGMAGLSLAGAAIADAVSSSLASKFIQQETTQPRLTSRAILDRGGVHELSRQVGRIPSANAVESTVTLGDGTVLEPPAATATAAISQSQAWGAFVAYGNVPNVYVLPSTPAPTIELAQLSKAVAPDGVDGDSIDTLVWAIQYRDVAIYNAVANRLRGGSASQANPNREIGYFDVFVDANTGQVLYTTAYATYH